MAVATMRRIVLSVASGRDHPGAPQRIAVVNIDTLRIHPCHSATEDAKAIYQTVSGGKFREVRGRRPARDRGPHLGLIVCNPYCVGRASFGPRSLIVRNVSRV